MLPNSNMIVKQTYWTVYFLQKWKDYIINTLWGVQSLFSLPSFVAPGPPTPYLLQQHEQTLITKRAQKEKAREREREARTKERERFERDVREANEQGARDRAKEIEKTKARERTARQELEKEKQVLEKEKERVLQEMENLVRAIEHTKIVGQAEPLGAWDTGNASWPTAAVAGDLESCHMKEMHSAQAVCWKQQPL